MTFGLSRALVPSPPPAATALPLWTPEMLRQARRSCQFIRSRDQDILDDLESLQQLELFSAGIATVYTGIPMPQCIGFDEATQSLAPATSLPQPAAWSAACAGSPEVGVPSPLSSEDLVLAQDVEDVNASLLLR